MRRSTLTACRIGLIGSGLFLMGAGIWREEVTAIFMKAVNICFQCIGLG